MESQLPSRLPPNRLPPCNPPISLDHSLQEHLQTPSITASRRISEFTQSRSPIPSPNWLDHCLGVYPSVHLISVCNCIPTLPRSRPQSASWNSLDHGLQGHLEFTHSWSPMASPNSHDHDLMVHLSVHSISASKCISKPAWSWPQSAACSSLDLGLQVNLPISLITASKYTFQERRWLYGDTGVTEVESVTRSIYSGDPGVDVQHPIFIPSCHTTQIHTLSFPTFGLTCSFWYVVDPPHCMDPHGWVVSYLLTFFLRSLSYNHTPSWVPFGCCGRCGRLLMVGYLPSSSVVSPQWPACGASLGSLNERLQVLLRLC